MMVSLIVHKCVCSVKFLTVSTNSLTEVDHITALKCVASFLVPKRTKQEKKDRYAVIPYLLIDVPLSFMYSVCFDQSEGRMHFKVMTWCYYCIP